MQTFFIVEAFDPIHDIKSCLISRGVSQSIGAFNLGLFTSNVTFKAQRTTALAVLKDPSDLQSRLAALPDSFSIDDVNAALAESLKISKLTVQAIDVEAAKVLLTFYVRTSCIRPTASGLYERKTLPSQCLSKPLVVFNEAISPIAAECTAKLALKSNGTVHAICTPK